MSAKARSEIPGENVRTTIRVHATPDQTWAVDADYLHGRLDVLRKLGAHYANRIWLLDLVSDVMLVAGVVSTFFIAW